MSISKLQRKVKSCLSFSLKLFILVSFLISQSFMTEIFLYEHNPSGVNVARAAGLDPWYNSSWLYREKVTIPHSNVPHTDSSNTNAYLTNFPVLVSVNIPTNKVRGDHNDIIFTNADGSQTLNYEIESYDGSGNLTAWVQMPQLNDASNTADSSFYIYYGNSGYTTVNTTSASVWDGNFKGVYHLKETGTGVAGDYKDSTGNANSSTNATNEPTAIAGQIGSAESFNGSTNYIRIGNNMDMGTSGFTFDFWAKTSVSGTNQTPVYAPISGLANWDGEFRVPSGTRNGLFFVTSDMFRYYNPYDNSSNTTNGVWHHFVGVCDRSQHIPPSVYLDGTLKNDASSSYCDQLSGSLSFNGLYIGSKGTGYYYFNGAIDEVRISSTVRSADWIKTEYNNESNPNTFYTLGGEEDTNAPVLSQITPVPTPTDSSTPSYTFSSTKAGTITYGGDCSSATTAATAGNNTIVFNLLSSGIHSNCTLKVTDGLGQDSNALNITSFTVNNVLTTYIVPAISDNKILPKSTLSSSYLGDTISAQISQGEYKAESFVVNSNVGVSSLEVEASNLTGNGSTISSSALDIKAVKCWYQGGTGTIDYSVQGRFLTPELLLKDDSLVNVDGDNWDRYDLSNPNGKNYLKVNGSYTDISSDTPQNTNHVIVPIADRPVQDSTTLQPLTLPASYNKQFWITLHMPDDTPAGNYAGTIHLKDGAQTIKSININIQVLPIILSQPNIEYSAYYIGAINDTGSISSYGKTTEQYTAEQNDMRVHGITDPATYDVGNNLSQELSIRQQAGMDNTNLYYVGSIAANNISSYKNLTAPYGVANVYQYGPDEKSLDNPTQRTLISDIHNAGGMYFNAQSVSQADSIADLLDLAVVSGTPSSALAAKYHSYGHKIYSYANPQTVPEYPRTFRKNYGLALWQSNYDGAMDFAYQYSEGDVWNDFDNNTWRDHNLAYPTANGVIDTVQWEGFREGVNDMRYLATLQNAIAATKNHGGDTTTAIEAENYLANLKSTNLTNQDLDAIRSQMIDYIIALQSSTHSLTVSHGTGTGFYAQGKKIAITANASQAGMTFYKWTGGTQYIDNVNSASATVTMPFAPISLTATYTSAWYDSGYTYRKQIAVDHAKVSNTTQTNFPVLVSLTDPSLKTVSNGGKVQNSSGYDIVFTLPNKTPLDYEIESYDGTSGKLVAWVKIPSLSAATDTFFYMYYGNSSINASLENKTVVWDSNYKAVYHLGETGSGAAGDYKDSTSNVNNSTNTTNQPSSTASGQIGGAENFDGATNYIRIGNSMDMGTGGFTFDFWAKTSFSGSNQTPVYAPVSGLANWSGEFRVPSSSRNSLFFLTNDMYRYCNPYDNSSNTTNGTWHHFVGVCDRSQHIPPDVYLDGTLKNDVSGSYCDQLSGNLTFNGLYIGSKGTGYYYFNGAIDEVRISSTARSADWIKTEYNNEASPSTFYALGTEENLLPPTITSVSAALPSGSYSAGTSVPLTVTFSKDVTSTGSVTLTLNTTPQRTCAFTVTNSNTATCTYIVQSGDRALSLNSTNIEGNITDQFGNPLTNFTPQANISDNNIIGIDTASSFSSPVKPNVSSIQTAIKDNIISSQSVPSNITQIAISRTPDFKGVSWMDFDKKKFSTINQTSETLYVKFRTREGAISDTLVITPSIPLQEGDIVKTDSNPDVYIIKYKNNKQYKRLILSPSVFNSYQHLKWSNIKTVSQPQLDTYTTSNLVEVAGDKNIYELFPNGDQGERKLLDIAKAYDRDSVYEINGVDRDSYVEVR